jgi:alpha-N-arabinofuranosidase
MQTLGETKLGSPQAEWRELFFEYTPTATTKDATLQIELAGDGDVFVDQVSMMANSSQATGGFRPDLLQAIAALRPPVIRWPGGSYSRAYRWKDGIGPQAKRRAYAEIAWEDRDVNSFGTDEFVALCRNVGAEPVIVININARGKAQPDPDYLTEAAEWLEYCNGPAESRWGRLRALHGHPEPYRVKYWEIDNEIWGLKPEVYVKNVRAFAAALRKLDPQIKLVACGSGSMGNLREHWAKGDVAIIEEAAREVDYLSIHHYELPKHYNLDTFRKTGLLEGLAQRISRSANPNLKFFLSEWNVMSTDWRTGLYAGGILNYFERTPQVGMASPALFLRHISAKGWDNALINFDQVGWFPAPNYVVMKLWRDHYAPNLLACTGDPHELSINVTKSEIGNRLFIKVVNPSQEQAQITMRIQGGFTPARAAFELVAPGALEARNTMAEPSRVRSEAGVAQLSNRFVRFSMPPLSLGVVTVERQ